MTDDCVMEERSRPDRSRRVLLHHGVYIAPVGGSAPPRRLVAEGISFGGMFVRCGDELPEGTMVAVDLEVHGLPMPFAEGEVIWQRADLHVDPAGRWRMPGFAVRFFPLNRRAQALLEYLVAGPELATPHS